MLLLLNDPQPCSCISLLGNELIPGWASSVSFHWCPKALQSFSVCCFLHLPNLPSWPFQLHRIHICWMVGPWVSSPDALLLLWSPEWCCAHSNSELVQYSSRWGLPDFWIPVGSSINLDSPNSSFSSQDRDVEMNQSFALAQIDPCCVPAQLPATVSHLD